MQFKLDGRVISGIIVLSAQAKRYADRLNQGQDLVMIEGTEAEIQQAEFVLKPQIQDWVVYHTI